MPGIVPYIALARRDHDFRIVETSGGFPWSASVRDEAQWLALDWWGNCFAVDFTGAMGHIVPKKAPDTFFLMLVQPGPVAPDRFVVFLSGTDYSRYGFNPFQAIRDGVFDFTEQFYRERGEAHYHINWKSRLRHEPVDSVPPGTQQSYDRGAQHLSRGNSILIPTRSDGDGEREEFERFTDSLSPEVLKRISMFTFTNTTTDKLDHFGTLLASVYNSTQSRTLNDVLRELVSVDENGSLFRTIRRTETP
jgi:hypothetical protein